VYPIVQAPRAPRHPAGRGSSAQDGPASDAPAPGPAGDGSDDAEVKALQAAMAAERALRAKQEILLERQREEFDFMLQQRAEFERERNALEALMMEQRKHDDEILKEWIRLA
jgi:hypothetical protein